MRRAAPLWGTLWVALAAAAGCQPYRVEYHVRPAFHYQAASGELPSEITLADGTVVKFIDEAKRDELRAIAAGKDATPRRPAAADDPDAPKSKPIWEENEDGSVTMRAYLPEQVIANFMQSLREERYGEFWRQLASEDTRREFERNYPGEGEKRFAAWGRRYRRDLMSTLNRISFGYLSPDVFLRRQGTDRLSVELTPKVTSGGNFKFTRVEIVYEKGLPRLLGVR